MKGGFSKVSTGKKSRIEFDVGKRQKDLEMLAQDALKFKIYHYLEEKTNINPNKYLTMTLDIYDAIQNTAAFNRCIEIVSFDLSHIHIGCYLAMQNWEFVDILKLVKVGLSDQQFSDILTFFSENSINLETFVVSSNKLT